MIEGHQQRRLNTSEVSGVQTLDKFIATTRYHRKFAVRVLKKGEKPAGINIPGHRKEYQRTKVTAPEDEPSHDRSLPAKSAIHKYEKSDWRYQHLGRQIYTNAGSILEFFIVFLLFRLSLIGNKGIRGCTGSSFIISVALRFLTSEQARAGLRKRIRVSHLLMVQVNPPRNAVFLLRHIK